MSNFYEDNVGYKKFKEKLKNWSMIEKFTDVVGDAIQYGMKLVQESRKR